MFITEWKIVVRAVRDGKWVYYGYGTEYFYTPVIAHAYIYSSKESATSVAKILEELHPFGWEAFCTNDVTDHDRRLSNAGNVCTL
jgi:hypothetical protein